MVKISIIGSSLRMAATNLLTFVPLLNKDAALTGSSGSRTANFMKRITIRKRKTIHLSCCVLFVLLTAVYLTDKEMIS